MSILFAEYLYSLNNYELLVLYKYRINEINESQEKKIEIELKRRNISPNDYTTFKKEENRIKSKAIKCPRCKTKKVIEENLNDKIVGIWTMDIAFKYAPWTLKNKYRCELCGYYFKKWPSLREVYKRLWMD